ncbi:MAG: hypothetical protein PHN69_05485 [Candidatus Pacebacteria bacterium]|nr:hypothetical protein [Candidatus Paceibacterota bacterium]
MAVNNNEGLVNTRQITKYQTGKTLLELNDRMVVNDNNQFGRIHSAFSKIHVVALDYSKGTGSLTVKADLNIDPIVILYLAEEVMIKGDQLNYSEQKILAHKKNPENEKESRVTIFSAKYNSKMRYPWNIIVENGWGVAVKQPTGGTSLGRGTYRKDKQVKIVMADNEFKKMLIATRNYIQKFEHFAFFKLMKKRTLFEEEKRKEKK